MWQWLRAEEFCFLSGRKALPGGQWLKEGAAVASCWRCFCLPAQNSPSGSPGAAEALGTVVREKEARRVRGSQEWAVLWETRLIRGKIPRNKGQKNMAKASRAGGVGGFISNHSKDCLQASSGVSVMDKVDGRMHITVMMVCQSSKNLQLWDTDSLNPLIF